MDFYNDKQLLATLPSIADMTYEPLERKYKNTLLLSIGFLFLFIVIAYLVAGVYVEALVTTPLIVIFGCLWAGLLLLSLFFTSKSCDYSGYVIRHHDILYKSGYLFQSLHIVPFNRVQHCEIQQGPFERWFNLAELTLFTAGGGASDVSIHGLSMENALKLKDFVTSKITTDGE